MAFFYALSFRISGCGFLLGLRTKEVRSARRASPTAPTPCSWCRIYGLRFKLWGLGFRVSGSGFRVSGFGFRVWGLGFRVQGLELDLGLRVLGSRGFSPSCGASGASLLSSRAHTWLRVEGLGSGS